MRKICFGLLGSLMWTQVASAVPIPDEIPQIPDGVTERPDVDFSPREYAFMHSSTHLQGLPAEVKYAPGLLYNPPVPFFTGHSSAVIVNNPSPTDTITFAIEYFDDFGFPVGTTGPFILGPEDTYAEGAAALANSFLTPG